MSLQPDTLLLDETMSALDKSAALEILQILKESLPDSTILLVSHQQEIIDMADVKLNMDQTSCFMFCCWRLKMRECGHTKVSGRGVTGIRVTGG